MLESTNTIIDFNAPADIDHFIPVNPYALNRGTIYLYHYDDDLFAYNEQGELHPYYRKFGEIPRGDYIVEFKRYRSSSDFAPREYGDVPISWKQSSTIRMVNETFDADSKKKRRKETERFAQCRLLYYRPDAGIPWALVDSLDDHFRAIHVDSRGSSIEQLAKRKPSQQSLYPTPVDISVGVVEYYFEIMCGFIGTNAIFDLGEWSYLITKNRDGHPDEIRTIIEETLEEEAGGYESGDDSPSAALEYAPELMRQISANLTDQETEDTCWANVIAKMITKVIRETVPQFFDPLVTEHYCNSIYSVHVMKDVSHHVSICDRLSGYTTLGEQSMGHNLLLFTFIYKILINQYGCAGNITWDVMKWFIETHINTSLASPLTSAEYVEQTFMSEPHKGKPCVSPQFSISPDDCVRIAYLCNEFCTKLAEKNGEGLRLYRFTIPPQGMNSSCIDVIKYVIDSGYYLALSGRFETREDSGHVITIVNYSEEGGHFYVNTKNSLGKTIIYDDPLLRNTQGKAKMIIDSNMAEYYKNVFFVLPSSKTESKTRSKTESKTRSRSITFPKSGHLKGLEYCNQKEDCDVQYGEGGDCISNRCWRRIPTSTRRNRSVPTKSKKGSRTLTRRRYSSH